MSDFDGTLSPIVDDPGAARLLPAARRVLRALAREAVRDPARVSVAILSGRSARDVAARVRIGGLRYLGSHGVEDGYLPRHVVAERLRVSVDPALASALPDALAQADAVAAILGHPAWLVVEPKASSVGLHYRLAPDPERARAALSAALSAAEERLGRGKFERLEGRRVVELWPAGVPGKGPAVARLVDEVGAQAVLVVGDDVTDADAFAVVAALRASGQVDALLVGVSGAGETPPEIVARADLVVPGPSGAALVLRAVSSALQATPADRPHALGRREQPADRPGAGRRRTRPAMS